MLSTDIVEANRKKTKTKIITRPYRARYAESIYIYENNWYAGKFTMLQNINYSV